MNKKLEEVHASSTPLMQEVSRNHQNTTDLCSALRFLLKSAPGTEVFVSGIDNLLVHLDNLKRLATSYHTAVGEAIKEERVRP